MLDDKGKYFLDWLSDLREGRCANEAGAALAEVVDGVHETAGPGSVTITLRVALKKDTSDIVETIDQVAKKTPEERRDTWWFGKGGTLMRSRPRSNEPGLFDQGFGPGPDDDPGPSDEDYDPPADDDGAS